MRALLGLGLLFVVAAPARADWSAPVVLSEGCQLFSGLAAGRGQRRGRCCGWPGIVPARSRSRVAERVGRSGGRSEWGGGQRSRSGAQRRGSACDRVGERTFHGVLDGRGSRSRLRLLTADRGHRIDNSGKATVLWRRLRQYLYADVMPDEPCRDTATLPSRCAPAGGRAAAERQLMVSSTEGTGPGRGSAARRRVEYNDVAVGRRPGRLDVAAGRGGSVSDGLGSACAAVAARRRPSAVGTFGAPTAIASAAGSATSPSTTLGRHGDRRARACSGRPRWRRTQKVADIVACRVLAEVDVAGALYVAGDTDCGGALIWARCARPAGASPARSARSARRPTTARRPSWPQAPARSWPGRSGPRRRAKNVMTAVAFRAVPLIAFASEPRVRDDVCACA